MKGQGRTNQINTYYQSKLIQAEEKKEKLLHVFYTLSHLTYDKGSREGDAELRDGIKDLMDETELHYNTIKSFGDAGGAFREILNFYDRRYLNNSVLGASLNRLQKEVVNRNKLDREYNIKKSSLSYQRKINIPLKNIERALADWEKNLSLKAVPLLAAFLIDLNELVLCDRINQLLDNLKTGDDDFFSNAQLHDDFKKSTASFLEFYIKIRKIFMTDADMLALVNHTLEDMSLREIILGSGEAGLVRMNGIIQGTITEYKLADLAGKFIKAAPHVPAGAREKEAGGPSRMKDLARTMEELCFLENLLNADPRGKDGYTTGLARKADERYLFYSPGTFDVSLKYIAEYLRDGLIFIIDWLIKETQKTPASAKILEPVLQGVLNIGDFIGLYKRALETASIGSNQSEAKILSQENHYITKEIASGLIKSIMEISRSVQQGLVDSSINARKFSNRESVLIKKIKIVQDSFNNSFVKINRGFAKIDKA